MDTEPSDAIQDDHLEHVDGMLFLRVDAVLCFVNCSNRLARMYQRLERRGKLENKYALPIQTRNL